MVEKKKRLSTYIYIYLSYLSRKLEDKKMRKCKFCIVDSIVKKCLHGLLRGETAVLTSHTEQDSDIQRSEIN